MSQTLELTNPVSAHKRHAIYDGPDKPRAVMLICHGFGEHCERYRPMMSHMKDHGIATLSLDQEGHGQSEGKRGVCHSYDILHADVDLLKAQAASQFPGVPVFLLGHSMGGGLVLNYGLKHGSDGLQGFIVTAPLIHPAEPIPGPLRIVVKMLRRIFPNVTLDNSISGDKVSSVPEEQEKYENDPLNHGRLGVGLAADIIEGGEWVAENAANWRAPLLLMHARQDKLTRFDSSVEFAAKAQNCTFIPFENCEHEVHNDVTRDQVYGEIIKFIEARI